MTLFSTIVFRELKKGDGDAVSQRTDLHAGHGIRSNFSGLDHRQMVCNSKFVGSQTRYLSNQNVLGVATFLACRTFRNCAKWDCIAYITVSVWTHAA